MISISWHGLHWSEAGWPICALQVRRNSSKLLTPAPAVGLLSRALRSSLGVRAVSLHNLLDQAPSLESQLVRGGFVHARGGSCGKGAAPAGAFPAETACMVLVHLLNHALWPESLLATACTFCMPIVSNAVHRGGGLQGHPSCTPSVASRGQAQGRQRASLCPP